MAEKQALSISKKEYTFWVVLGSGTIIQSFLWILKTLTLLMPSLIDEIF
jgi:hypothetical protein